MKKIKAEFSELGSSKEKRPAYWKGLFKLPDARMDGMFRKSLAVTPRALFRVDPVSAEKTEIPLPKRSVATTIAPGVAEKKQRDRAANFRPRHNRVMSRKFAHMENGYPSWRKLKSVGKIRIDEEFESIDPKEV